MSLYLLVVQAMGFDIRRKTKLIHRIWKLLFIGEEEGYNGIII